MSDVDAGLARITLPVRSLSAAVAALRGDGVSLRSEQHLGGGSINEARRLQLSDGTRLFLKRNRLSHEGLFREEARGLLALRTEGGPRVPQPLALFEDDRYQYLLMEYVAPGGRSPAAWAMLGRRLAVLHASRRSERAGFPRDNHIGSTPQINTWSDDWHSFFARHRLLYQVELAARSGLADASLVRGVERLAARLGELLPDCDDASPGILHGDLWGGNVMMAESGEPVLIDPAAYYGHREADLAMTELFGGFSSAFYDAYREQWPLVPGYSERRDIYNLYHLLNHLNLFGRSYLSSCVSIVRSYA